MSDNKINSYRQGQKTILAEVKNPIYDRQGALKIFLNGLNKLGQFNSRKEEHECAMRMVNGCEKSREELVLKNLKFVVKVASQYNPHTDIVGDLISEGCRGMWEATYKFDPTRGIKFISFAVWYVRMRIINFFSDQKLIKISTSDGKGLARVKAEMEDDFKRNEGRLSSDFIEENDYYLKVLDLTDYGKTVCLDDNLSEQGEPRWALIKDKWAKAPDKIVQQIELKRDIKKMLNILTERERYIIDKLFGISDGFPLTINFLSDELGLTQTTVRTIRDRALFRMRMKV